MLMDIVHEIAEDTITLIEDTVREHLEGFNIQPCNVLPYIDATGEEGISVGICYDDASRDIDPRLIIRLVGKLRDNLVRVGEFRSPYVRHYFQTDQVIEGTSNFCGAA